MDCVQTESYNILYTTKIKQKQKKNWIDGIATFTYSSSNSLVTCQVVDMEGGSVIKGRVSSDALPIDECVKFVLNPYLIQVCSKIEPFNYRNDNQLRQNMLKNTIKQVNSNFIPPSRQNNLKKVSITRERHSSIENISKGGPKISKKKQINIPQKTNKRTLDQIVEFLSIGLE